MVGQAFDHLQLRLVQTTLDFLASPIFQVVVIDTVVQGTRSSRDRVHASRPDALGTLEPKDPSPFFLVQQLGGSDEIARLKLVRLGGNGGFEQPSPDHLDVVTVHVGRCHVDAGMNALVVAGQQFGHGVQVLWGIVDRHVLVDEFFERVIEAFGHGGFRRALGGTVGDAILVQQPFHVLVVKLLTLIGLQLHGSALGLFVFQQVAQGIAHDCAPFALQSHHPGILAQDIDDGEQVARATIVLDQFRVLHLHQIGLPGMIDGGAGHRLLRRKRWRCGRFKVKVGSLRKYVWVVFRGTPSVRAAPSSSSALPLKA